MRDGHDRVVDGATRVMQLFGERWTFLVLREAFFGIRRFNQMQRNLEIPRNMLADRLGKLVAAGVMERHPYRTNPDHHEYRLTSRGLELYPAILAFGSWGDRHLAPSDGDRLYLRHKTCDELVVPRVVCSGCGEDIHAHEVEPLTSPGHEGVAGRESLVRATGSADAPAA